MDARCHAKAGRRKHVAAVVGALSLFVALVAGSALRPHYTGNVLPEPQAWTHAVQRVTPDPVGAQKSNAVPSVRYLTTAGRLHAAPNSRKPFRNVWMTREFPSSWVPVSSKLDWSTLPESFGAAQFQPRGAPWAAPAADVVERHRSTLFCIIRC